MRLLPLMLILSGCAMTAPAQDRGADELAQELAGQVAGPAQQCIPTSQGASLQPAGRGGLVHRQGRTIWVTRLSEGCPGFRPMDTLIVEIRGDRYCRNDVVRSVSAGGSVPGPSCLLGDFVPYRRP